MVGERVQHGTGASRVAILGGLPRQQREGLVGQRSRQPYEGQTDGGEEHGDEATDLRQLSAKMFDGLFVFRVQDDVS